MIGDAIEAVACVPWWVLPLAATWYAFAWWLIRYRLMRLPCRDLGHVARDDAVFFWTFSPLFGFCAAVLAAFVVVMMPAYWVFTRFVGPALFGRE